MQDCKWYSIGPILMLTSTRRFNHHRNQHLHLTREMWRRWSISLRRLPYEKKLSSGHPSRNVQWQTLNLPMQPQPSRANQAASKSKVSEEPKLSAPFRKRKSGYLDLWTAASTKWGAISSAISSAVGRSASPAIKICPHWDVKQTLRF